MSRLVSGPRYQADYVQSANQKEGIPAGLSMADAESLMLDSVVV